MNINALSRIALFIALACCAAFAGEAMAQAAKNRLVIQVSDNDPAKWNLALNNAKNVQADLGSNNVEIEIVAYGPGLAMLKKGSAVSTRVDEAVTSGVKVLACENTMRNQKVEKSEMIHDIGYVGAGVVEIMQKQQQGWAYLRP